MNVLPIAYVGDISNYLANELTRVADGAMLVTSQQNVRSAYQQFIASGFAIPSFQYDPLDQLSRDTAEMVALLVTNAVLDAFNKGRDSKTDYGIVVDGLTKRIPMTFSITSVGSDPVHFLTPNWRFFSALGDLVASGISSAHLRYPIVSIYELLDFMEAAGIRAIDNTQRYLRGHRKSLQEACDVVVKHLEDKEMAGLQSYCRQIVEGAKTIIEHRTNTQAVEEVIQEFRKTIRSLKIETETLQNKVVGLNQTVFDKDNEIKALMAKVKHD